MRALRAALLLSLALPGVARAGDVTIVARDLPVGGRQLAASPAPVRFDLAGLHWQGPGSVLFRTRSLAGRWSAWRPAQPEAEDRPNRSSAEGVSRRGWRLGNPYWTGPSDRIEVRLAGRVRRLRAWFVWSPVEASRGRALSIASAPPIVTRAGWNADEAIVRVKPRIAPALGFAVVHHTAGSNGYTAAQSAAIVRGIEVFHVKANGWNDIGYNFLVDRYGQVFEGRAGGMERNVVGAHAEGFNTGSVGVALIGSYGSTQITPAQRSALVKLLAWRLDVAHADPLASVSWRSGGNAKYKAGSAVTLRTVSGHRDTGFTECPGSVAYAQLPSIGREAAATGLPKLYEPVVAGTAGRRIRFTARLSAALRWTVRVGDAEGTAVATGTGTGSLVDWTWDSTRAGPGPFVWSIEAPGLRPATGAFGGSVPTVVLAGLTASPALVLPNALGASGTTTIGFTLGTRARVSVKVLDANGNWLMTLVDETRQPGPQTVLWAAGAFPDGRYTVQVSAKPSGKPAAVATTEVVVDRTLTGFAATPSVISPNGDGVNDTMTFSFGLTAAVPVTLTVVRDGVVVATLLDGMLEAGGQVLDWDGTSGGVPVPDGAYEAVLTVTGAAGPISIGVPITVDTIAPTLRIVDAAKLRFWLSEPATVTLLVNGKRVVKVEPEGPFSVPRSFPVETVSGIAVDTAGNVSPAVRSP